MLLIVLEERITMKEINKEQSITITATNTLTEEEMSEVTGGARVNAFAGGGKISKNIFYWTRNIWK